MSQTLVQVFVLTSLLISSPVQDSDKKPAALRSEKNYAVATKAMNLKYAELTRLEADNNEQMQTNSKPERKFLMQLRSHLNEFSAHAHFIGNMLPAAGSKTGKAAGDLAELESKVAIEGLIKKTIGLLSRGGGVTFHSGPSILSRVESEVSKISLTDKRWRTGLGASVEYRAVPTKTLKTLIQRRIVQLKALTSEIDRNCTAAHLGSYGRAQINGLMNEELTRSIKL